MILIILTFNRVLSLDVIEYIDRQMNDQLILILLTILKQITSAYCFTKHWCLALFFILNLIIYYRLKVKISSKSASVDLSHADCITHICEDVECFCHSRKFTPAPSHTQSTILVFFYHTLVLSVLKFYVNDII